MKSLMSYLLVMLMGVFWLFRLVVAFTASLAIDIGFQPMNMVTEIVLLFVVFACILLVAKDKIIGGIIYLVAHAMYFGVDLYYSLMPMITNQGAGTLNDYTRVGISFIAIVLPIAVLFMMLIERNRTAHPVDKQTDWFYKNDEFDRKLDERADQNEYRNY